jgi:hypothetical protein
MPRSRMCGATPPLPNTPSWCGAQLKHRDNFILLYFIKHLSPCLQKPSTGLYLEPLHIYTSIPVTSLSLSIESKYYPQSIFFLQNERFWIPAVIQNTIFSGQHFLRNRRQKEKKNSGLMPHTRQSLNTNLKILVTI